MTGWHDFPTLERGGYFLAHSEYFVAGRPASTGGRLLNGAMIVSAFGPTAEDAEARRDREKPHIERRYL